MYYGVSRGNVVENIKKTHPVVVGASAANIGIIGALNIMWTLTMLRNMRKPVTAKTLEALTHNH